MQSLLQTSSNSSSLLLKFINPTEPFSRTNIIVICKHLSRHSNGTRIHFPVSRDGALPHKLYYTNTRRRNRTYIVPRCKHGAIPLGESGIYQIDIRQFKIFFIIFRYLTSRSGLKFLEPDELITHNSIFFSKHA